MAKVKVYLIFPLAPRLPHMAMMRKTKRAAMSAATEVMKYGTDMVVVPVILDDRLADHKLVPTRRRKHGKA